jgi:hypothetical protein
MFIIYIYMYVYQSCVNIQLTNPPTKKFRRRTLYKFYSEQNRLQLSMHTKRKMVAAERGRIQPETSPPGQAPRCRRSAVEEEAPACWAPHTRTGTDTVLHTQRLRRNCTGRNGLIHGISCDRTTSEAIQTIASK